MTDADSSEGRSTIIRAVRSPMGFFALIALVLDGVLIILAGSTESVSLWLPLVVLVVLIVAVSVIVLVRPEALGDPMDLRPVTISLVFPHHEPINVQLDAEKCELVIRDKGGHARDPISPNLTFGHGGWACRLQQVKPSDSVRLELTETNGRVWRVNPFAPFETAVTAVLVTDAGADD